MATQYSTTHRTGTATSEATPEPVLHLASTFMAAKHLFAANELGLFEALAPPSSTFPWLRRSRRKRIANAGGAAAHRRRRRRCDAR